MDIKKLFSAPAIIIDEKVKHPNGDLIGRIKDKFIQNSIPIIEFEEIPSNQTIKSLINISFILLDWELFDNALRGTAQAEKIIQKNFKFIRKIKKEIFVPIFIFTNSEPDDVKIRLVEKKLYKNNKANFIFIKRKHELFDKTYRKFYFFKLISEWIKSMPSIYALKEWEYSLNIAKNKLFWDFYNINHKWPSVLQKTFTDDGSDVNYELGNFIFKNIMARTEPITFDKDILKIEDNELTKKELRNILESERFLKNEALPFMPFTGDLYKYRIDSENEDRYYLNIRPECNIARKSNPDLYCLKGKITNENDINSRNENEIQFINGSFIERTNKIYIPFLLSGKILEFSLNDIKVNKWNELKNDRLGRILPPYITAIQQKYSFYLQRQGLPAIPKKAIKDEKRHCP